MTSSDRNQFRSSTASLTHGGYLVQIVGPTRAGVAGRAGSAADPSGRALALAADDAPEKASGGARQASTARHGVH
jgi:hypothetical protein